MAENSTKKSAVFKTFPIDISNTFIQAYNGEEVVVIGTNYTSQHDNISNTPLLYVSGDSQFHKNVTFDGSDNLVDICGTLFTNNLKLGNSVVVDDLNLFKDCILYTDISGNVLSTGIEYTKIQYISGLDFSGNTVRVYAEDDFIVASENDTLNPVFIVKKDTVGNANVEKLGINTINPVVTLDISSSDALQLPVGENSERPGTSNLFPTVRDGMVRFNSENNKFEGYYLNHWRTLGGIESVDEKARIEAIDTSNNLEFYASTDLTNPRMVLESSGNLNLLEGTKLNIYTDSVSNESQLNLIEDSSNGYCIQYYNSAGSGSLSSLNDTTVSQTNAVDQTYSSVDAGVFTFSFTETTGGKLTFNTDVDVSGTLKATTLDLTNGAIHGNKITDGTISNSKLDNNSITIGETEVQLGNIIYDLVVDTISAETLTGTLNVSNLTGDITTNMIEDGAITTSKIQEGSITNILLGNNSITLGSTEIELGETHDEIEGLNVVRSESVYVQNLYNSDGLKIAFQLEDTSGGVINELFKIGGVSIYESSDLSNISLTDITLSGNLTVGDISNVEGKFTQVDSSLGEIISDMAGINSNLSTSGKFQSIGSSTNIYYDSGSVVIGKSTLTSSEYTLDVCGNFHVTGDIYKNGELFTSGDKTEYKVTVQNGKFYLDGVQQYVPVLKPGVTYTFDQSDSTNSGHPLRFYTDANKTSLYTSGVTVNSDIITIDISNSTQTKLHYQCSAHSNMGSYAIVLSANDNVTNDEYAYLSGLSGNIQSQINDLSNNVYSQSYIDDLSNNVYSQSYIDDLSNNVYSQSYIDDLSNNVYSKSYVDSSYSYLNTEIIDLSNTIYGDRTEYKVTVQNGKFYLDGHEQFIPVLKSGVTYTFDQSDSTNSGHPFRFYTDANKTTSYTSGVTVNSNNITIQINDSTPSKIHYQCSAHNNMGSYAIVLSANEDVTNNEYSYLSGLSGNIQTQITDLSNNVYSQSYIDTSYSALSSDISSLNTNLTTVDNKVDDLSGNIGTMSKESISVSNTTNIGGSIAYDNSTGVISFSGPTTNNVRDQFSAGTGVTISSGEISIGQSVSTSDDVEFNTLTVIGNTFIRGNLELDGSATYVNTNNVDVSDNIIVLNSVETRNDSGILIRRKDVSNVFMGFDEPAGKFVLGETSFDGSGNGSQSDIDINTNFSLSDFEVNDISANNIETTGNVVIGGNLTVNTDNLFVNASTGQVGIGTSSVGNVHTTFEVYEDTEIENTSLTHGKQVFVVNWGGNEWAFGQGAMSNNNGDSSSLGIGPRVSGTFGWNPKFIFTSGGNLGIGSNNPSEKLVVSGNAAISGTLSVTGTITGSITGQAGSVANGVYTTDITDFGSGQIITDTERTKLGTIEANADVTANAGAVMNTGNETIAGTKTFSSTISGSIDGNAETSSKLASSVLIGGVSFDGSSDISTSADLQFGTIGIGTSSGSYSLNVNGNANIDGDLILGSSTITSGSTSGYLTSEDSSLDLDGWMYCKGLINSSQSAGSPSAIIFGNGNSLGTNQISLVTTGSTRLHIDSNGNIKFDTDTLYVDATNDRVGINNSSPNEALDVTGNAVISGTIDGGAATFTEVVVDDLKLSGPNIMALSSSNYLNLESVASGSYIRFRPADTDMMNITTSGVRIGGSAGSVPTSGYMAQIDGSLNVVGNAAISGELTVNNVGKFIGSSSNTNQNQNIDDPGVYIGALNGIYGNLQIVSSNTGGGWIDFAETTSSSNIDSEGRIRYGTANGMIFYTNGLNERVRIDTDGNVGIGTNNPTSRLYVDGDTNVTGSVTATSFYGSGANITSSTIPNSSLVNDSITIGSSTVALGGSMTLGDLGLTPWTESGNDIYYTTGNVGIGTNDPDYTLDVDGDAAISGDLTVSNPGELFFGSSTRQMINLWSTKYGIGVQGSTTYFRSDNHFAWHKGGTHSGDALDAGTGGTTLMVLDSDGHLGIMKTNASYTLDVSGSAYVQTNNDADAGLIIYKDIRVDNLDDYSNVPANLLLRSAASSNNAISVIGFNHHTGIPNALYTAIYSKQGGGTYGSNNNTSLNFAITDTISNDSNDDDHLKGLHGAILETNTYLTIRGGGLIGINNTSPSEALDVTGNAAISGTLGVTGVITSSSGINVTGTNFLHFGSDQTKDSAAGKIGYGAFNSSSLAIVGAGTTSDASSLARKIRLYDMVGIGTTPTKQLDVDGDATIQGKFVSYNDNTITYNTSYQSTIANTGDVVLKLQSGDTSSSYLAMGKYDDELDVGFSYWANSSEPSARYLSIRNGGANRVQISETGDMLVDTDTLYVDATNDRVGINKTSPTEALDVTGNTAISGTLNVSGNITDGSLPLNCGAHYYFYETVDTITSMSWGDGNEIDLTDTTIGDNTTSTVLSTHRLGSITSTNVLELLTTNQGLLRLWYKGGYSGIYNIKFNIDVCRDTAVDRTTLGIKAGLGSNSQSNMSGIFWDFRYTRGDGVGEHAALHLDFNVSLSSEGDLIYFYTFADPQSTDPTRWVCDDSNTETANSINILRIDMSWQYLGGQ